MSELVTVKPGHHLIQVHLNISLYLSKYVTFLLFVRRVLLIAFTDASFALYSIQRKIRGYSMNFSFKLVFPNAAQRKIAFSKLNKLIFCFFFFNKGIHFFHKGTIFFLFLN